ncbi:hypothetical protein LMG28138_04236 [Pararobbsia alpina]|uniref:GIY-YIG domain-containing protein n=1 Tax=Pararobbsia alpina TaxID=621374 RepID=A0A6S7BF08_9BURK|nr:hypothetical protein LMG28138_04236 [Pararobbsia alpina]
MQIERVGRYKLSFDKDQFTVECPLGTDKFSGLATSALPKLYVVSALDRPIYVGITKQSIRNRLRLGWSATGKNGYHGYAWRSEMSTAVLDIWCHRDPPEQRPCLDIETIEAEVVYLIRKAGQWPLFQTEIHFHESSEEHRTWASQIVEKYSLKPDAVSLSDV